MRHHRITALGLTGLLATLAACGRTNTATTVAADANAIVVGPAGTGTLKLRKIYDYGPVGFSMSSGYRYEASFQGNGEYNYPEPIFEGWPIRVTPVDASGNATGAAVVTTTLRELQEGGGRYLELPAGRYRVEELPPSSTAGGGKWVATGANATQGGKTTPYAAGDPITVEVVAGTGHTDATVVRFFNVCQVAGQPVRFVNDESATSYSMPQACAPIFDTGSANPNSTALDSSFGNGGWAWADLSREGAVAESVAVIGDGRIAIAGTGGVSYPQDPKQSQPKVPAALLVFTARGQLDSSFSGDGVILLDPDAVGPTGETRNLSFSKVLGLPDNRILAVGTHEVQTYAPFTSTLGWVLARFLPDGSLDSSFGSDGTVYVTPPGAQGVSSGGRLFDAELLPDGKILVAGSANLQIAAAKFNPDGSLDTGFGNGGVTRIPVGPISFASALAFTPDGGVVLGGVSYAEGAPGKAVLARLGISGQLDTSYGDGGVQVFDFGGVWDTFNCVLALQDGRVIAAGSTQVAGSESVVKNDVIVMQFLPSGARDASFGANGLVRIDNGVGEVHPNVVRDTAGRLVLQIRSSGGNWVLARLTTNGLLDTSFGNNGLASFVGGQTNVYSPGGGEAFDLALQADSKVVIAGYTQRLLPNQLPTSFMTVARVVP